MSQPRLQTLPRTNNGALPPAPRYHGANGVQGSKGSSGPIRFVPALRQSEGAFEVGQRFGDSRRAAAQKPFLDS